METYKEQTYKNNFDMYNKGKINMPRLRGPLNLAILNVQNTVWCEIVSHSKK